jgi:hypothetical protein
MTAPTLVVMAAGMGSRYGGDKQVEGVGPKGERLLEYAIYDAHRTGFGGAVFIIRPELTDAVNALAARWPRDFSIRVVYQEKADVPEWFAPPERDKPWGTVHAVLAARHVVNTPFVVINADDFYGAGAYDLAAEACREVERSGDSAMIGLRLDQTLSDHGAVARGIAVVTGGELAWLDEAREVGRTGGRLTGTFPDGVRALTGREVASMNYWVFPPTIFRELQGAFDEFLRQHGLEPKSESLLPEAVNAFVQARRLRVRVYEAPGPWFGLTHFADRPKVMAGLQALVDAGVYPAPLWKA